LGSIHNQGLEISALRKISSSTADATGISKLPDQLERELNLAGRCLRGGEKSRALNALPILIEDRKVVGGRGKIRTVENIEKLRSELGVKAF
jgi:hypothetical protein